VDEQRLDPVADIEAARRRTVRRTARRRSLWLSVLLPFIAGTLVIAAVVAVAWRSGAGTASSWADTSLTFLLLPLLLLCLLPFALLVALSYGLVRLMGWLPGPLDRLDQIMQNVQAGSGKATRAAVRPIIQLRALWAALGAGFERFMHGNRGE